MTYAATSTNNNATTAPHSNNAALRSESPYQPLPSCCSRSGPER
jgi:hypothetical protein